MDNQRIAVDQPDELERWAAQLGVSVERLQDAIVAVGPEIDKLKTQLAAPAAQQAATPE
jgi:uncharacterized small protein (DUF1192 family)